jgi:hypothetical protein
LFDDRSLTTKNLFWFVLALGRIFSGDSTSAEVESHHYADAPREQ